MTLTSWQWSALSGAYLYGRVVVAFRDQPRRGLHDADYATIDSLVARDLLERGARGWVLTDAGRRVIVERRRRTHTHTILARGAAFDEHRDRVHPDGDSVAGTGRALCSRHRCDWMSDVLPSAAARRRAFAEHRDQAIADGEERDRMMQDPPTFPPGSFNFLTVARFIAKARWEGSFRYAADNWPWPFDDTIDPRWEHDRMLFGRVVHHHRDTVEQWELDLGAAVADVYNAHNDAIDRLIAQRSAVAA